MQISEAVNRALQGSQLDLGIVADWIEDNHSGHPEKDTYCRRLRDPKTVRIQTLVDAVAKFGTRPERREICRIWRIVLRCRKSTIPQAPKFPDRIAGLSARRRINHQLGNIVPTEQRHGRYHCDHKRVVIANCKKRRVYLYDPDIQNNWSYLMLFRQLLKITQPGVVYDKPRRSEGSESVPPVRGADPVRRPEGLDGRIRPTSVSRKSDAQLRS